MDKKLKSLILLGLFASVFAIPPKSYKAEFERFEVQFNKVYENEVERLKRFEVFQENLEEYESFNNEGHNWRKGINQFSSSFRRLPLLKYLGVGEAKFRGSGRGVYSLPFHYPYFFSGVGLATRTPFLEW